MMKRRYFLLALPPLALLPLVRWPAQQAFTPELVPLAKGLDNPWGMAFLPDGSLLITERSGQLRRLTLTDNALGPPISGTPTVDGNGQGGLLGLAIAPDYATSRRVFMSFAAPGDNGNATAVYRARLSDDMTTLEDGKEIFRQNREVASPRHFGSRLVFNGEGHLFVTTGDRGSKSEEAQNSASHIGKVLRITVDGAPAPGNPKLPGWAPEVWSIGHRNIQGATLHPDTGQFWTTEHGAKGGDEINTPQAGKNYGWPVISYGKDYSGTKIGDGTTKDGMEQPLHYWDPSIAPSGMAFITSDLYPGWKGSLVVGALAGSHIARLAISGTTVTPTEKLFEGFARFRDVAQGPDGRIYVLTDESAPDGGVYVIAPPGELTAATR